LDLSRRFLTGIVLATIAAVAACPSALAGPPPTVVNVKDDKFKPDVATQPIFEGSTNWFWADDVEREHNVRQDSKLFYSGPPTDDPGASYTTSLSAGTYHYFCEVHGSRRDGMDGIVRARPYAIPVDTASFTVYWAYDLETGDQFDVRYRVGKRKFKTWHSNTALKSDTFGNGNPINVVGGKTYTFQARSELSTNPNRRSGWSPKLVVTP
jgi:plastocyanin